MTKEQILISIVSPIIVAVIVGLIFGIPKFLSFFKKEKIVEKKRKYLLEFLETLKKYAENSKKKDFDKYMDNQSKNKLQKINDFCREKKLCSIEFDSNGGCVFGKDIGFEVKNIESIIGQVKDGEFDDYFV